MSAAEAAETAPWVPPTWDEVVREHADRVYRLAFRLSGNRADAEDLTQETFVRVFKSLAQYAPGTFEGWLHRITTNLFLDMVRRRARIRFDSLGEDADDRLPGRQVGAERQAGRCAEQHARQDAADQEVTGAQRRLSLCCYNHGRYDIGRLHVVHGPPFRGAIEPTCRE